MNTLIAARRTVLASRFSASDLVPGRGFLPLACPGIRFLRPLAFPAFLILLQYGTRPSYPQNQGRMAKKGIIRRATTAQDRPRGPGVRESRWQSSPPASWSQPPRSGREDRAEWP